MKTRAFSAIAMALTISLVIVLIPQVSYAESLGGLSRDDFMRISEGGFGDPMNNYAWSMAYFDGDLYVGTGRNILYMMGLALKEAAIIPPEFVLPDVKHPDGKPGDPEWAEDMLAEIWRYHSGEWKMVHKATPFTIETKTYPEGIGYRIMTTFDGAIYAGVGGGFGDVLLVRSTSGDCDTWEPVDRTGIPLYYSDTRAMVAHCGKLYVGTSGGLFGDADIPGEVYANPEPGVCAWTKVTDFASSMDPTNTAVLSLASFNGRLYATTQNAVSGFQVWRSKCADPQGGDDWERIVTGGAGDAWNVWGGTTETFNDHLYVGSMSLPIPPLGPKGFDLIRIDECDDWDLIVGSYRPSAPTVPRGPPLSGWPAGFANPLNFYCWSLEEHDGYLYLGTFDASTFLPYIPPEQLASLFNEDTLTSIIEELREMEIPEEYEPYVQELLCILEEKDQTILIEKLVEFLVKYFGGADLWKSPDGIHWIPVSLNGFDNPHNYGFRTLVSVGDTISLFVGTANPFDGCEVWVATEHPEFVIPEYPIGTVAPILAMSVALAIFALKKRNGILPFK